MLIQQVIIDIQQLIQDKTVIPFASEYELDIKKINELGDLYNLVSQFIVKDKLDLPSILTALKENEDYKFLYNDLHQLI